MPSAAEEELIPGLYDADDVSNREPEPEFNFAAPPSTQSKKSKKKSKKKDAHKGPSIQEADVTPSPPKDNGVRLGQLREEQREVSGTPSPPTEDGLRFGGQGEGNEQLMQENGGLYDVEIEDKPVVEEAQHPIPPPSIPTRSPRPVPVRPAQPSNTPPSRPASLNSPPQFNSGLAGYRASPLTTTDRPSPSTAADRHPPPSTTAHPPPPPPYMRRESAAHTSPRPRFVEPVAPPHKLQPHFYGLPDFGLNFGQQKSEQAGSSKAAGSDGYCCCFDSFADAGEAVSGKKAKDALLVGSEGALEAYRVLPDKLEVVGRLEGLRGGVIGAKILPQVSLKDEMQRLRPLVAVIIHGAMREEGKAGGAEDEPPAYYQTTVEVYSLKFQTHVATLYRGISVAVEKPAFGHTVSLPGPVGDLTVTAEGKYVAIASGKSGEVLIFSHAATMENQREQFRCLGKFWTSLQTSPATATAARPQSSSEGGPNGEEKEERAGVPVFSLSQRWLALMAPSTSAHVSIGGAPTLLDFNPTPPGVSSHVAPQQPPISSDIAGVDAEGTWTRFTRQAAQGLVKYSHIGLSMGKHRWYDFTHPKDPKDQPTGQHSRGASREHDAFPPTMAPMDDPHRVVKEPAIVSIVDLDELLEAEEVKPKYASAPLSTFALQEGCNYLSLSSSGLRLLSVSRSGKVSTVWDLTQSCHGTARLGLSAEESEETAQGPCVKQLQRFERNSESVVVGATWSRDDDMLAVLTSHGTVHLHEVPPRPSRKRKRRYTSTANTTAATSPSPPGHPEKAQPTVGVSSGASPPSSGWMGSLLKTGLQSVKNNSPAAASVTSFRPSFAGFREITASAGQVGGRVIARGLSQGYTAAKGGVGDYWHAEDNKIRFPGLQRDAGGGGVGGGGSPMRWVRRPSGTFLAAVCAGTVHLHPVQRAERRRGEEVVSGLKRDRYGRKSFVLPLIKTAASDGGGQQSTTATASGKRKDDCEKAGPHGFWCLESPGELTAQGVLHPPAAARGRVPRSPAEAAPASNEVETNPPYCPFHVDSRVGIYAFDDEAEKTVAGADDGRFAILGQGESEVPWVFGRALPGSVRLNVAPADDEELGFGVLGEERGGGEDDEEEYGGGSADGMAESRVTVEGGEVRVHTTRLRAGGGGGGEGRGRGRDVGDEEFGDVEGF